MAKARQLSAGMNTSGKGFGGYLIEKIDQMGGDTRGAVEGALQAVQHYYAENLRQVAAPYKRGSGGRKGYATGAMYDSIIDDGRVSWTGDKATTDVGFNLQTPGGQHSVFVMRGTPKRKASKMQADRTIYNAVYGPRAKHNAEAVANDFLRNLLGLTKR